MSQYVLLRKELNYVFQSDKSYRIWGEIEGIKVDCLYPKSMTKRVSSGIMILPNLLSKNMANTLKEK